ncbi:collagen alpha-1(I) chain-like [Zonotrichia leucophrys gambelii]|uniref:collagen alpha-1(I) chain-like n=1 Tax=Zonotrichia leucophrys gambelii TaxID=257770 RepID=UPI0031402CF9
MFTLPPAPAPPPRLAPDRRSPVAAPPPRTCTRPRPAGRPGGAARDGASHGAGTGASPGQLVPGAYPGPHRRRDPRGSGTGPPVRSAPPCPAEGRGSRQAPRARPGGRRRQRHLSTGGTGGGAAGRGGALKGPGGPRCHRAPRGAEREGAAGARPGHRDRAGTGSGRGRCHGAAAAPAPVPAAPARRGPEGCRPGAAASGERGAGAPAGPSDSPERGSTAAGTVPVAGSAAGTAGSGPGAGTSPRRRWPGRSSFYSHGRRGALGPRQAGLPAAGAPRADQHRTSARLRPLWLLSESNPKTAGNGMEPPPSAPLTLSHQRRGPHRASARPGRPLPRQPRGPASPSARPHCRPSAAAAAGRHSHATGGRGRAAGPDFSPPPAAGCPPSPDFALPGSAGAKLARTLQAAPTRRCPGEDARPPQAGPGLPASLHVGAAAAAEGPPPVPRDSLRPVPARPPFWRNGALLGERRGARPAAYIGRAAANPRAARQRDMPLPGGAGPPRVPCAAGDAPLRPSGPGACGSAGGPAPARPGKRIAAGYRPLCAPEPRRYPRYKPCAPSVRIHRGTRLPTAAQRQHRAARRPLPSPGAQDYPLRASPVSRRVSEQWLMRAPISLKTAA